MDEKAVIVTGASRGVGAAAAKHAARFGARIAINARSTTDLERIASEITSAGGLVEVVPGDLREERVCREVVAATVKRFGRIDGLLNNAGVLDPLAKVEKFKIPEWESNWRVNLLAPMYLTSLALPYLRKHEGRVVNVSSGASVRAYTGWAAYCGAKAALNICTEAVAVEEPAVTAVTIRPGMVDTEMQETVRSSGADVMTESELERFLRAHDRGELASPDEVGFAVAVLVLFAKPEWSGDFIALHDDRVSNLVASKRSELDGEDVGIP